MRLFLKEKKFSKISIFFQKLFLRFLSLRYGADFRRSRIYQFSIRHSIGGFVVFLLIFFITAADSRFGSEPLESPRVVFSFGTMFIFLSLLVEEFSKFLSGVSELEHIIIIFGVKLHVNSSCLKLTIWTLLPGSWYNLCIVNGNCGCCDWQCDDFWFFGRNNTSHFL